MQLDKSKPYGTVFGEGDGWIYEQGGNHFNGDGSLWAGDAAAPSVPATPKAGKQAAKAIQAAPLQAIKAISAEDQQVLDQLKA